MLVGPGNLIAFVALLAWIPLTLMLFMAVRPPVAAVLSIIGAEMLLPVGTGLDLPAGILFDKGFVGCMGALLGYAFFAPQRLSWARPGRGPDWFVIALLVGALGTHFANQDPLFYGPTILPPMRPIDLIGTVTRIITDWWLPYFIGRATIRSTRDLKTVALVLAGAGLLYTLPILLELRLSPQLHRWVYGYHQHTFGQTLRAGGYRPMVFMYHGLNLTLFLLFTGLAASMLVRARVQLFGFPAALSVGVITVVLFLCRSLATQVYACLMLPAALFLPARTQLLAAVLLASILIGYPFIRTAGLVPLDEIASTASLYDENRANSLRFRVEHEDQLIEKFSQRPLFGWGTYARNGIWNLRSGRLESVFDGAWLIVLGQRGLVGYLAIYGMLLWPVFHAWRSRRFAPRRIQLLTGGFSLIVVTAMLDTVPNSAGTSPYVTFLAGVLAMVTRAVQRERKAPEATPQAVSPELPRASALAQVSYRQPSDARGLGSPR